MAIQAVAQYTAPHATKYHSYGYSSARVSGFVFDVRNGPDAGDAVFTLDYAGAGVFDSTVTATTFIGAVTGAATQVTVADESTDTTCFPLFVTAATGNLPPKSGTNLAFNSASGVLTATGFAGDLTGNVTGDASGNAGTATVLETARTINGVSFDGSANITVTAAAGTLTGNTIKSTVVTSSLTTIGTLAAGAVPASLVTAGTFGTGAYVFDNSVTGITALGVTTSLTLTGTAGAAGIDINPGSDIDADLISVIVSGFPKIWWDEAPGAFAFSAAVTMASYATVAKPAAFDLVSTQSGQDNLWLTDPNGTPGDEALGASIGFSAVGASAAANRRAAIAAIQTDADSDRVGLAFYTHAGTVGGNPLAEAFRIEHDKTATFASTCAATDFIGTIGATTPAAGAFTTGAFSGNVGIGVAAGAFNLLVQQGQNDITEIVVANATTGTGSGAQFKATSDTVNADLALTMVGSGATGGTGTSRTLGATIQTGSAASGGMSIAARGAAADVRIFAGGIAAGDLVATFADDLSTVLAGTLTSTGNFDVNTNKFTVNATSGDTLVAGDLVVSGTGPHAIGGTTSAAVQLFFKGAFTGGGGGEAYGIFHNSTITSANGDTTQVTGSRWDTTITTQSNSETVAIVAQASFYEPDITKGTDTITNASTIFVAGAPTEGGTINAGILCDANIFLQCPNTVAGTGLMVTANTGVTQEIMRDSSSARFKTGIRDADIDPAAVLALNAKWYGRTDQDGRFLGFIAEDFDKAGFGDILAYDDDGPVGFLEYGRPITAMQQVVLQDHDARIKAGMTRTELLEARIEDLETELAQLRAA